MARAREGISGENEGRKYGREYLVRLGEGIFGKSEGREYLTSVGGENIWRK